MSPDDPSLPPSRQEKRARIIDAAIEVFAEKGFRGARISDIAAEAGIAAGTIYLYFKNKDEVLLSIFEEKMEEVIAHLKTGLEGISNHRDRLRIFARTHFDLLQEHPSLAQVFQVELRQSHRFLREYRPEHLWAYLSVIDEIIRDGQAAGIWRGDLDPFLMKWAFFGALDELSIQWVLARKRERFNLDQAADQVVMTFDRGMAVP